jgi:beta-1,4-N-acetylglucosaminyltransferase
MPKICLVCSSGGHLMQLYLLKPYWINKDRFWISFPGKDTKYLLKDERKYWAFHPTNRSIKNLIKNLLLAYKLLKKEKPSLIISTGAGIAVPFILIGKFLKIKTIFIESITRNEELSLSARLIYPFVDNLLVQWKELKAKYPKAEFKGRVL